MSYHTGVYNESGKGYCYSGARKAVETKQPRNFVPTDTDEATIETRQARNRVTSYESCTKESVPDLLHRNPSWLASECIKKAQTRGMVATDELFTKEAPSDLLSVSGKVYDSMRVNEDSVETRRQRNILTTDELCTKGVPADIFYSEYFDDPVLVNERIYTMQGRGKLATDEPCTKGCSRGLRLTEYFYKKPRYEILELIYALFDNRRNYPFEGYWTSEFIKVFRTYGFCEYHRNKITDIVMKQPVYFEI